MFGVLILILEMFRYINNINFRNGVNVECEILGNLKLKIERLFNILRGK